MIETDEDKSKFEEIYQEYRNLMYYVAYKRMQHNLASNTSLTYAGQIKYSTPKDHLGTISTFYMDCSYRKEVDPVAQYNVAK